MYDKEKHPRAPNQNRMLVNPWEITEGAEKLLHVLKEFDGRDFLSTRQLGYLIHVPQRKVRGYLTELVKKKRIKISPEDRKSRGPRATNSYEILNFNHEDHNWE